jgi:hypothetical protein
VDSLEEWMQQKIEIQPLIQHQLARTKNCMKLQADKKRTERSFSVGTCVYQAATVCSKFSCSSGQSEASLSFLRAISNH